MATAKLSEIPPDLPAASTSVRDDVYDTLERFVGPQAWSRNPDGTPVNALLGGDLTMFSSSGFIPADLTSTMKRIKNIPQWDRGLNSKPGLRAEWDAYFKLLPRWIENVYARLDEKNNTFSADGDATDESREINWMRGRLLALQTNIDFAAQEALAPPPEPKFAPPAPAEPKPAEPKPAEPKPGEAKPSEPAPSSAPPKASEDAQKAAAAPGMSTGSLWLIAGAIALGAVFLASRKR